MEAPYTVKHIVQRAKESKQMIAISSEYPALQESGK